MKFKALLTLALVTAFCVPAQARVTFGVVPPANNLIRTDDQALHFADYLQRSLGEEVKLRILSDEETLHNWLNRFREVDVAVLSRAYIDRQPAGEFFALTENFRGGVSGAPQADPLIARQGISLQLLQRLQQALDAMAQDQGLRSILWPAPVKKPAPPRPKPAVAVQKALAKAPEAIKQPKVQPKPEAAIAPSPEPKKIDKPQSPPATAPAETAKTAPKQTVKEEPKQAPTVAPPEEPAAKQTQPPSTAANAKAPAPAPAKKAKAVEPHPHAGHHEPFDYLFWTGILAAALGTALVVRFMLRLRRQKSIERFNWVPEVSQPLGQQAQQGQTTGIAPLAVATAEKALTEKRSASEAPENNAPGAPEATPEPVITEESLGLADLPEPAETSSRERLEKATDPGAEITTQIPLAHEGAPAAQSSNEQTSEGPEEEEGSDPLWAAITEIEETKNAAEPETVPAPATGPESLQAVTEEQEPQDLQPVPFDFDLEASEPESFATARHEAEALNPAPEKVPPLELADEADEPEVTAIVQDEAEALEMAAADEDELPLELADEADEPETSAIVQDEAEALEIAAADAEEPSLELADESDESDASAIVHNEADQVSLDQNVLEALEAAAEQPIESAPAQEKPAEKDAEQTASIDTYEPDAPDREENQALNGLEESDAINLAKTATPAPDEPGEQTEPAPPGDALAALRAQAEPLKLNLRGRLGEIQIPALLQLIAPQTRPGSLIIVTRHDEKRFHFRNGRISLASSVSRANRSKSGFLMNKVGYLLIRQGVITEEQRDQALELCEKDSSKRIGEALIELGALSREDLMEALRDQAESIIFSLFIFPEGHFEFVYEDFPLRPENDLAIEVPKLLEKAAHHEAEWNNIRGGIPSLDTVLDFAENGRKKLSSARMTVHQKLVLSLIDGKRPIKEICVAATMLDLEVYKFLYFMVHANILRRIEPARDEDQLSA